MGKFKIDLRGVEELEVTIANASPKTTSLALKVVRNNTEKLTAQAKRNAPYLTGFLHDNIVSRYLGMQGISDAQAYYSGFQEYGTRYIAPKRYMRRALNRIEPLFINDMNDILKGVFKWRPNVPYLGS